MNEPQSSHLHGATSVPFVCEDAAHCATYSKPGGAVDHIANVPFSEKSGSPEKPADPSIFTAAIMFSMLSDTACSAEYGCPCPTISMSILPAVLVEAVALCAGSDGNEPKSLLNTPAGISAALAAASGDPYQPQEARSICSKEECNGRLPSSALCTGRAKSPSGELVLVLGGSGGDGCCDCCGS